MRMAPHPQGQPANSPFPHPGMIMPGQPQGLVQPNHMRPHPDPSCQLPGHLPQPQMQMQMQMQMQSQLQLQAHMQMQMHMQTHESNCHSHLATIGLPNQALQQLPVTGTSTGSGGDSQSLQIKTDPVQNAHMVSSSNHMHSRTQVEVPSTNMVPSATPPWNPTPVPALNIHSGSLPTPSSNPTPGLVQLPHLSVPLQPNPFPMLNNNMHMTAQQSAVVQQLASVVANIHNPATLMHILSFVQCFQNGFPSAPMPSPQINNYQSMPPQGSTPGLASHTNPQAGPTPPTSPYPPPGNLLFPMQKTSAPNAVISNTQPSHTQFHNNVGSVGVSQNQSQIPNQLHFPHPPHPPYPPPIPEQKHLTSQSLPSDACPPFSSNPTFSTPTQPTAQTFTPPFMVQNVGEMSQMAAAHLAGNIVFQGGGQVPMHQNHQPLQQIQHYMYPSNLQPSQASSNEQDGGVENSPTTNDMQHRQNGSFNRGLSSGIGGRDQASGSGVHRYNHGGRLSTDHGRRPEAEKPYPKRKIGSSGISSSEQAEGRAKLGFPLPNFSHSGKFNNGPSRFQKNMEGARSYADALICKNCDLSFNHRRQLDEHLNSHVKCDEPGCSFDASGKMLKEHMLIHQKKQSGQASVAAQRAASLKSESAEEIQQYREERKRNYPTESNITRKAQAMRQKKARGELIDEDAKKRRQRLREILDKQAELGIQVAEVPDHYVKDRWDHQKGHHKSGHHGHFRQDSFVSRKVPNNNNFPNSKKSRSNENGESNEVGSDDTAVKVPRLEDLTSPRSVLNDASDFKVKQSTESIDTVNPASGIRCTETTPLPPGVDKSDKGVLGSAPRNDIITNVDMQLQHNDGKKFHKVQSICRYFQKGFCRKGQRCHHLHVQMSNDSHNQTSLASKYSEREPTLLEKLLSPEIKREKSHLLQIFRFMVNNSFFSEWPNKSLNFFQWSGEASNVNPEQAEGLHLSHSSSIIGIDEVHTQLDEDVVHKKIGVDETESSSHEDIEEGEIVEGEIE